MSLFKRGNVWWAYVYRNGIRHQRSTGTSNRRRAEKIETKYKEELDNLAFQIVEADPNIRFRELAARFIASGSVRPHHIYHLKFLLPFFADFPALRITKSLAEDFRKARHAGTTIKEATVNRDLSVLRRILFWALDEQLIVANPLARMRMARERKTRRQILSIAEEQSLLAVAKNHLHTMIITALDTGMRRGEITGQRWEDVDLPRKLLFVTRSKTPEGESREIPLSSRLYKLLLDRQQAEGLVFSYKNRPLRIVKRSWKTALGNARIRHLRFHDLRHTFATQLMEAGVLQEVRMALMGHSGGSKIHQIYTHIELPVKREAIAKLEAWKIHQETLLKKQTEKEKSHGNTEDSRSEGAVADGVGTETVEEEVAGPGALRPSG